MCTDMYIRKCAHAHICTHITYTCTPKTTACHKYKTTKPNKQGLQKNLRKKMMKESGTVRAVTVSFWGAVLLFADIQASHRVHTAPFPTQKQAGNGSRLFFWETCATSSSPCQAGSPARPAPAGTKSTQVEREIKIIEYIHLQVHTFL